MPNAATTRANLIPALRYRDPRTAIDWLCRAFGFEKHAVYEHDGQIVHAELSFGNGMIMLGPVADTEFGRHMAQPDEIGGRETQSCYLIAADADIVYASARAAGAEILRDIRDADYGGRGFSCRDPEGHIWSIGTYDPWDAGK